MRFWRPKRRFRRWQWTRSWGKTTVTLEPVGVAGLITAWNANALFLCLKLASAVAAGCTSVIKPSELSSLQTRVWSRRAHGKPAEGSFNVVTGRGDVVGAELVRNPDVAKISFTGSVAVGEVDHARRRRDHEARHARAGWQVAQRSCSMMPISIRRSRRRSRWPF